MAVHERRICTGCLTKPVRPQMSMGEAGDVMDMSCTRCIPDVREDVKTPSDRSFGKYDKPKVVCAIWWQIKDDIQETAGGLR
jgi:hypothetical protein